MEIELELQALSQQLDKINYKPKAKPKSRPIRNALVNIKSFDPGFDSIQYFKNKHEQIILMRQSDQHTV